VANKPKKKDKFLIAFGENLRKIRNEKGMSQLNLSIRAKISQNYIGNIERAEFNATLKMVKAIADALKVEVTDLFNF